MFTGKILSHRVRAGSIRHWGLHSHRRISCPGVSTILVALCMQMSLHATDGRNNPTCENGWGISLPNQNCFALIEVTTSARRSRPSEHLGMTVGRLCGCGVVSWFPIKISASKSCLSSASSYYTSRFSSKSSAILRRASGTLPRVGQSRLDRLLDWFEAPRAL